MLGIIGGMGPQAGSNLFDCILEHSKAVKDQDHLPVVLWSTPNLIVDRSEFLLGKTNINPAHAVSDIIKQMNRVGVKIFGFPCNTFHAKPIWNVLLQNLSDEIKGTTKLVHMIEETVNIIAQSYPQATVGILGTLGTYKNNVYGDSLTEKQIKFIEPGETFQKKVHQSIYDVDFGIKANGKITNESLQLIHQAAIELFRKGAKVIILGCTELSLVPKNKLFKEVVFIDPVEVLAKAMINAYSKFK